MVNLPATNSPCWPPWLKFILINRFFIMQEQVFGKNTTINNTKFKSICVYYVAFFAATNWTSIRDRLFGRDFNSKFHTWIVWILMTVGLTLQSGIVPTFDWTSCEFVTALNVSYPVSWTSKKSKQYKLEDTKRVIQIGFFFPQFTNLRNSK